MLDGDLRGQTGMLKFCFSNAYEDNDNEFELPRLCPTEKLLYF